MNKKTSAIILIAALITTLGGAFAADQAGYFNINNAANVAVENSTVVVNNSNVTIGANNTINYPDTTPTPNSNQDPSNSNSTQTVTQTPTPTPTLAPFDPTITSTYFLNNTDENYSSSGDTISFRVTNPITSANSAYPMTCQFTIIEVGVATASPTDVTLKPEGLNIMDGSADTPLTLTADGNELMTTSSNGNGITITSGFDTTYILSIGFNVPGTFNLGINLIPAT